MKNKNVDLPQMASLFPNHYKFGVNRFVSKRDSVIPRLFGESWPNVSLQVKKKKWRVSNEYNTLAQCRSYHNHSIFDKVTRLCNAIPLDPSSPVECDLEKFPMLT